MKTTLDVLAANLKHGAWTNTPAQIGGGEFSPAEQADLYLALKHREVLLQKALVVINHCIPRNEDNADELAAAIRKELT